MTDTETEYRTFWICNGVPTTSYAVAEQRAATGAVVCEVSATEQAEKAARQEQRHREAKANYARLRAEALRLQYERSAAGQRDSALRSAAESGGSIVTVATNNDSFAELDAFGRTQTNIFRR